MQACDHRSVGVLITNSRNELLLIERARPPLFWAPPAGHVDDHGDVLAAALAEVYEEVGLLLNSEGLSRVIDNKRMINNQCRRSNDGWHDWTVFSSSVDRTQTVFASPAEVKQTLWVSRLALHGMAYNPDTPRQLEPVWRTMLECIGVLQP